MNTERIHFAGYIRNGNTSKRSGSWERRDFRNRKIKTEADKDYRTDGVQQMRFGIEKQKENPEMNKRVQGTVRDLFFGSANKRT